MKERLTGAIILVALMVLLVPELLTGPIRTESVRAASATAGRKAHARPPLHTYTMTLGSGSSAPDAIATPAAQTQPAESSQASPAQTPAAATAETPARAPAGGEAATEHAAARASGLQATKPAARPVVREASAASSRGWVVQLGSFADRQNAVRLARSLEARGFRMSVSPARAGSRVLWRVRAGPAHDRTGAQHLAARLRALGHRGELLPTR